MWEAALAGGGGTACHQGAVRAGQQVSRGVRAGVGAGLTKKAGLSSSWEVEVVRSPIVASKSCRQGGGLGVLACFVEL